MRRVVTDLSDFRSPFRHVPFAGLGADPSSEWPKGRHYFSTAHFRAPYREVTRLNATLMGLGALPTALPQPSLLPSRFQNYVTTGAPMTNILGTAETAMSQIPRWAWGIAALGAAAIAYKAYQSSKHHP